MTQYDLKSLNLPKLYGTGLEFFTSLVENPLGRALLIGSLLENGGIPKLSKLQLDEAPTLYPLGDNTGGAGEPLRAPYFADFANLPSSDVPYPTIRQYAQAYRDGRATPLTIAEKVFASVAASQALETPLRLFIAMQQDDVLAQAHASYRAHPARAGAQHPGWGAGSSQRRNRYAALPHHGRHQFSGQTARRGRLKRGRPPAGRRSAADRQDQHARDRHQPERVERQPRPGG